MHMHLCVYVRTSISSNVFIPWAIDCFNIGHPIQIFLMTFYKADAKPATAAAAVEAAVA